MSRRAAKGKGAVLYSDVLTDREFDKLMAEGATEDDVDNIRSKKVGGWGKQVIRVGNGCGWHKAMMLCVLNDLLLLRCE